MSELKICKFYLKGNCTEGDKCNFIHDKDICKFYFFEGKCKKGSNCKFKHEINGIPIKPINNKKKQRHFKNTESFEPSHKPPDARVLIGDASTGKYHRKVTDRDIVVIPNLFSSENNLYNKLISEIDNKEIWKKWHGDSHLIADDGMKWKESSPTFKMVINRLSEYFGMKVKSTRFNWYKDTSEWKPYHHDAAAVKEHIAREQNFTVGVSFGTERDIAFEHAKSKNVVSFPLENGTTYGFGNEVNKVWRHGIPQIGGNVENKGRISIIAWGWVS